MIHDEYWLLFLNMTALELSVPALRLGCLVFYPFSDDEQAEQPPCLAERRTSTGHSLPVVCAHRSLVS